MFSMSTLFARAICKWRVWWKYSRSCMRISCGSPCCDMKRLRLSIVVRNSVPAGSMFAITPQKVAITEPQISPPKSIKTVHHACS